MAETFTPNGDGSWTGGPCKRCGSTAVLLDPTPTCLKCYEDRPSPDYSGGQGLGPCGLCGHDPSCGFSSVVKGDGPEVWLCHADDHSCFVGVG